MGDESTDLEQRLLHILEEAIEQERLSQRRHALGASLAIDPMVKEMFVRLVEDEMGHERTLRERHRSLVEKIER